MLDGDENLEEFYENFLDLFTHPGWAQFMEQVEGELQSHQENVFNNTKEQFDFIKGQVTVLSRIKGLPLMVEQGYQQLYQEEDYADDAF